MALSFIGGGVSTTDSRVTGGMLPIAAIAMTVDPADNSTLSLPTAANADLTPDTGYVVYPDYVAGDLQDRNDYFSLSGGILTLQNLPTNGTYYLMGDGYLSASHSANNSTVGLVFGFTRSGTTTLSARPVIGKFPSQGDKGTITGGGMLGDNAADFNLQNGDQVSVYIASDTTGTLSVSASNLHFTLYKYI